MKLIRFVFLVGIITCVSLIYLYQETETVKLSYTASKKSNRYQDLLEQNKNLKYNIARLKSVSSLGNKVLKDNANFEIPRPAQLAEIKLRNNKKVKLASIQRKSNLILSFFSLKSQAEAQTIK